MICEVSLYHPVVLHMFVSKQQPGEDTGKVSVFLCSFSDRKTTGRLSNSRTQPTGKRTVGWMNNISSPSPSWWQKTSSCRHRRHLHGGRERCFLFSGRNDGVVYLVFIYLVFNWFFLLKIYIYILWGGFLSIHFHVLIPWNTRSFQVNTRGFGLSSKKWRSLSPIFPKADDGHEPCPPKSVLNVRIFHLHLYKGTPWK